MKLGESDPTARRIGPIMAVDSSGVPVEAGFNAAGAVELRVNGGSFVAAGGTIGVIGDGYVYYEATPADAGRLGTATVKLAVVCEESTIAEDVELAPQGIPIGTTDAELRHIGPLRLVDGGGAPLSSLAGIVVEVSVNGSPWAAAAGALTLIESGYADYAAADSDIASRGWVAVKLTGACSTLVFRATVVGRATTGISLITSSGTTTLTAADRDALGDIALRWSNELGNADVYLDGTDLATDQGLMTAGLLSLFLDRRAEDDDVPPSGDPTDRRGWWADEFAEVEGDRIGSRLWLLDRAKRTSETALKCEEYVREGLAWMIEDSVVSSIDVPVEMTRDALLFAAVLNRPGADPITLKFSQKWDHMQEAA